MAKVYEARVEAADGGFGDYQVEANGPHLVEGADSISEAIELALSNEVELEPAPEIGGRIQGQNGGEPYKFVDGDYITYYLFWQD